jgi:hypothetical protein
MAAINAAYLKASGLGRRWQRPAGGLAGCVAAAVDGRCGAGCRRCSAPVVLLFCASCQGRGSCCCRQARQELTSPPTPPPAPLPPQMHGKTLERDLKGDLSGDMERLFVALAQVGAGRARQRQPACTGPATAAALGAAGRRSCGLQAIDVAAARALGPTQLDAPPPLHRARASTAATWWRTSTCSTRRARGSGEPPLQLAAAPLARWPAGCWALGRWPRAAGCRPRAAGCRPRPAGQLAAGTAE